MMSVSIHSPIRHSISSTRAWCSFTCHSAGQPFRALTALKPGGWLVVEDYDTMIIDRALPCTNADDAEIVRKCFRALRTLMELRGMT